MTAYDNAYSRLVAWLKILLPLAALAILSTLFLFSRQIGTEGALPYAKVDVDRLVREPQMTAPEFSGTTEDGAGLSISASVARPEPGNPDVVTGEDLSALLQTPDGGQTTLTAPRGRIDATAREAVFSGGVQLRNSSGYRVEADTLRSALDRTSVESPGPVTAEGPIGRLNAGAMTLDTGETGAGYVLVFKNRVELIYEPNS